MNDAVGIASQVGQGQRRAIFLGKALRALKRPSALVLLLLAALPALLWRQQTAASSLILFPIGVVGFFVLPGLAVVRALRLRCGGEELLALALGMGLAISNVTFAAVSRAHLAWLYWLLPLSAAGYLAWRRRAVRQSGRPNASMATSLLLVPVAGLASAMLLCMPAHAVDFTLAAGGSVTLSPPCDGTLHAAIANEVARAVPPLNPFVGDQALVYHYSTELSAAVFCKFFKLPAAAVSLRLLPTLFTTLTALAVFAFVRRLTGSRAVAFVMPLLVLLGEDFSFFPGLWKGSGGVWAAEYFSSPSVFGLYFVNPNLPALAAFFCGLVGLNHAFRNGRTHVPWLTVSAALLALAGSYKVFFGIQTLGALALATLLCTGARRRFVAILAAATGLCMLLLFAPMASLGQPKVIELVPTLYTSYLPSSLSSLGLSNSSWLAAVAPMFAQKHVNGRGLLQLFALVVPLFVVGTLGIRLVGLPALFRSLWTRGSASPVLLFVALFVVLGYGLGLGLRVTPIDYPDSYNNSVWFLVESKLVSWVFVAVMLGNLFKNWSPTSAAWVAALQVVFLAAPGSVNTFKMGSQNGDLWSASPDELVVARYFQRHVEPGANVACESTPLRRLLLGVSGMRVPLAPEFFLMSYLRRPELERRTADMTTFWQAWAQGHFRADLAAKYHFDYVISPQQLTGHVAQFRSASSFVYASSTLSDRAVAH